MRVLVQYEEVLAYKTMMKHEINSFRILSQKKGIVVSRTILSVEINSFSEKLEMHSLKISNSSVIL